MAKDVKDVKAMPGVDPSAKGTRTDRDPPVGSTKDTAPTGTATSAHGHLAPGHRDPAADLNLQDARAAVQRLQEQLTRSENEVRQLRAERGEMEQRVAKEQGRRLDADASTRRSAEELTAARRDEGLLRAGEMLKPILDAERAAVSGVIVVHGKDERHALYKLSSTQDGLQLEQVNGGRTMPWSESREELERLFLNHLTPADRR
jgi:TolA-binding protein